MVLSMLSDLQIHKLTLYEMKERDSKNTSLHYRKPLPELPLITVQSSLIMHCQGQRACDSNRKEQKSAGKSL